MNSISDFDVWCADSEVVAVSCRHCKVEIADMGECPTVQELVSVALAHECTEAPGR